MPDHKLTLETEEVQQIENHERARASSSHAPEFKFATDAEMLTLLDR